MIKFIWDEAYSVGVDEIDEQHRALFELGNSLSGDELTQGEIKKYIMELYRYTRKHFAAEEKLMKESDYPGATAHRALHGELISRLNAVSLQSFEDRQALHYFRKFVYDWIIDHILNHDMEFFKYKRNAGQ